MIKAIIFDLDGTLLYTLEDLHFACNSALKKFGLKQRTLDEVRNFVGNGVKLLMMKAAESNYSEELLACFKEEYEKHKYDTTRPYDGIDELLLELNKRNVLAGVVSNKFDNAVKGLSQRYFADKVQCSVGEKENVKKKPAPDSLFEVMRTLNVKKDEIIYVGDSEVDIQTAKNADVKCISVLWGFKDKQFLLANGANVLVSSPLEILDFLGE